MEGRPRAGAGVRRPAGNQGRSPTALGRPSALRKARTVRVRANHGPPERGRQSGGRIEGRMARESASGAGSGICTRKVGRQGRWTRPGPTARPRTVAGLTSSTERESQEYGERRIREEGGRARERERTGAGSPRIRHVEAGADPSRTATVFGNVDCPGVGMGHPKCLCRAIDRTVCTCTCRIVIGRMPSSESRLKRYLMTTFRKTMDDSLEALGKRGLAREGVKTTNPAVATGDNIGEGGSRRGNQKFRRETSKEVRNYTCANGSLTERGAQEEGRTPAPEGSAGGGGDRLFYARIQLYLLLR